VEPSAQEHNRLIALFAHGQSAGEEVAYALLHDRLDVLPQTGLDLHRPLDAGPRPHLVPSFIVKNEGDDDFNQRPRRLNAQRGDVLRHQILGVAGYADF